MSLLTVISTLFCLAGIGCGVVSLATTSWISPGTGLFQTCVTFIVEQCHITIGDEATVTAVACLIMFGLLLCIPSVVMLFADILGTNKKKVLAAGVILMIAGLSIGSAVVIYLILEKPADVDSLLRAFGFSFYMAWASAGAIILSGILAIASSKASN